MSSIGAYLFDPLGYLHFAADGKSDNEIFQRRVSANATLDGNRTVSDFGYAPADNVLKIEVSKIKKEEIETLIHIVKNHSEIIYTDKFGAYKGVLNNLQPYKIPIKFDVIITQKLT